MNYRAIVTFVLLISAALPAGANELSGSPARDGVAVRSAPAEPVQAAKSHDQFVQRTPSVPSAPQCDVKQRGTGTWKDGEIIRSGSATGSCTQRFECTAKPEGDKRPNVACAFTVHHSDPILKNGQCSDKECKKCEHETIKDKCEWWLSK
jgi:hypothetical protein